MGDGHAARFLGVILKVTLRVIGSFLTNDLDRVFVCADGTIRTKTEEHCLDDIVGQNFETGIKAQAQIGDIILNADRKMRFRAIICQVIEHAFDHGRCEILGGKTITSTSNQRHARAGNAAIIQAQTKSVNNILVEGFANGTRFLSAVENGNFLH